MELKSYLIDIDGTICDDIPNEEPERMATAAVFEDALATINQWYDEGHEITFFTARTTEHAEVTETWLQANGFKYHGVIYGKPRFDGRPYHWIDNRPVRATTYLDRFTHMKKTVKEIEVFADEPAII
ncbi:MAG: phosphoheptose isomerase [Armatimonadetes bacterium]|nr:phosphoheptose isomerase [Armatimonadota bacterium]